MGKFFKAQGWPTRVWVAIALLTLGLILIIPPLLSSIPQNLSPNLSRNQPQNLAQNPSQNPSQTIGSTYSKVDPRIVVNAPLDVNVERLWHHLTVLSAERFDERDRASTRDYITQTLEADGWAVRQQRFTVKDSDQEQTGINIIAEYPKGESQQTLLIGAHYDTVQGSPGADDNGTGIAAVLELAQLLSPNHFGKYEEALALKFVLFDLEEAGLRGSAAFVNDPQERKDIAGAIILEMLGYACHVNGCQTYPPLPIEPPSNVGDFLAVVGDRSHPHLVEWFQSPQAPIPIYTLTIPTLGPLTPDLLRSDHVPFWRKGIGAVMVTDTANFRNPHYHQISDRPETLNPDFFAAATQAILDAITLQETSQ